MELIKRMIITPQNENCKVITVSLYKVDGIYKVVDTIGKNTDEAYFPSIYDAEIFYKEMVQEYQKGLINMNEIFKTNEVI